MANTEKWRVLVVEDEYDSLQVVSKVLQYHHIHVTVARNGRECLQILPEVNPTLIVMDLAMPEMDGWETLVEIRANPATAHIPVVAVTAYGSDRVASDALQAGFNGYFPKPVSPYSFVDDLVKVVSA
jgi:CheY-like chemotaxis protein